MMCAAGSNLNSFAKNFAPPVMFSDLAAYKIHPIMTDPKSGKESLEKKLMASTSNIRTFFSLDAKLAILWLQSMFAIQFANFVIDFYFLHTFK